MDVRVKATLVSVAVALSLTNALPAWAQRGRGGGEGGGAAPGSAMSYDGKEFGIAFAVPRGLVLYTAEAPGRYRATLTERRIALLVNPLGGAPRSERVSISRSSGENGRIS